jgi:translation initiation factor 1A
MPKNKGKGGKNRRRGKAETTTVKRQLLFKEDGQEYALVTKLRGNCNVNLQCADNITRIGHIRGVMRKKVWVKLHDVCLVSLRDFQDGKADIIHVYDADEARMLQSYEELPIQWDNRDENNGENDLNYGNNVMFTDNNDNTTVSFDIDDI